MRILLNVVLMLFPWCIRRVMLNLIFGYKIDKTARIGFSLILPSKLIMEKFSRIGSGNICKPIDELIMKEDSGIGSLNFITGFSSLKYPSLFGGSRLLGASLVMGKSSAITSRHYIDVNGGVVIGDYSTIAGIRSTLLTHSIDPKVSMQKCNSIVIGKNNFIGTNVIFLPGSKTGDCCIVSAGSVVTKRSEGLSCCVASGNPAIKVKDIIEEDYLYFKRTKQFVD